jgi:hypothetical protein
MVSGKMDGKQPEAMPSEAMGEVSFKNPLCDNSVVMI